MKWRECDVCGQFVCLDCGECDICDGHDPDCPQELANQDADAEWREWLMTDAD